MHVLSLILLGLVVAGSGTLGLIWLGGAMEDFEREMRRSDRR